VGRALSQGRAGADDEPGHGREQRPGPGSHQSTAIRGSHRSPALQDFGPTHDGRKRGATRTWMWLD
jgi:hypothetical protein